MARTIEELENALADAQRTLAQLNKVTGAGRRGEKAADLSRRQSQRSGHRNEQFDATAKDLPENSD